MSELETKVFEVTLYSNIMSSALCIAIMRDLVAQNFKYLMWQMENAL